MFTKKIDSFSSEATLHVYSIISQLVSKSLNSIKVNVLIRDPQNCYVKGEEKF